jgi:hypothetical protein
LLLSPEAKPHPARTRAVPARRRDVRGMEDLRAARPLGPSYGNVGHTGVT